MKIIRILCMSLCLFGSYAAPVASKSLDETIQQAEPMHVRRAPHHHRAMSMAMMNELHLSDTQKAKWKELIEQKKAEIAPLRDQMKALHEQERQINEKYDAEIRNILTEKQLEKYKSYLPKRPDKKPPAPRVQTKK